MNADALPDYPPQTFRVKGAINLMGEGSVLSIGLKSDR
jgi:hypothetical protein